MCIRTTIAAVMAAALTLAAPTAPAAAGPAGALTPSGTASPASADHPGISVGSVGSAGLSTLGRPAVPTQETDCDQDQSGTHVGVGCGDDGNDQGTGGTNDGQGGNGTGGGQDIDPAEACAGYPGWGYCETVVALNGLHPDDMCGYVVAPDQSLLEYYHPGAPADATLVHYICPRQGLVYTEDTAWIEAWPPVGIDTLVNSAVFVSVTNWQGPQQEQACDGAVCVVLTATPVLTFDPGDHSGIVTCEAGGTSFDLASSVEPLDQAERAGACAHVHERASGIDGRPPEWPGQVTVTWTPSWEEEGGGGDNGDFDPIPLAVDLPRAVDERPSVVTGFSA